MERDNHELPTNRQLLQDILCLLTHLDGDIKDIKNELETIKDKMLIHNDIFGQIRKRLPDIPTNDEVSKGWFWS